MSVINATVVAQTIEVLSERAVKQNRFHRVAAYRDLAESLALEFPSWPQATRFLARCGLEIWSVSGLQGPDTAGSPLHQAWGQVQAARRHVAVTKARMDRRAGR